MTSEPDACQPRMASADGRRDFACFPAAILGFLVNRSDEILLLSHPARKGGWEVVNGAIEAGESPVDALIREVAEEAGREVSIRPVGTVHAFLHRYDSAVPAMFSIAYVATYLEGAIVPGGDMAMSSHRWATVQEIESGELRMLVPSQPWLFRRALAVHQAFRGQHVELEPRMPAPHSAHGDGVRMLSTMLFTDIVGSTDAARRMGDLAWTRLLHEHERITQGESHRQGGRVVEFTGDGVLALFPSPAAAIAAGMSIQRSCRTIGVGLRAGVHVGEVEMSGGGLAGHAVAMASRVCNAAAEGELLVSRITADILGGSPVRLEGPRRVSLKGIGEVELFTACP